MRKQYNLQFSNRIFQALVLILFGVCTTLDGNSILKLEGENGTKRVIIPGGENPMMGSYGSKCEVELLSLINPVILW